MILENNRKTFQELQNRIIGKIFEHYCLKPNDNVYETEECFMAVLGLPAGSSGVQLGQQSQANAMIFDDDGMST